MTTQNNTRDRALAMLSYGLACPSEAAELAGVSRQLVRYWIKTERIKWRPARRRLLKEAWRDTALHPADSI